jgi:UTP--glucose-1-phosphate uridylyltransferase
VSGLDASLQKMRDAGMPEIALKTFAHYYERLRDGDAAMLPESALESVEQLAAADELPRDEVAAREALERTIVLKLNGGLGTSMGLKGPKSLLPVKQGLSFLDLIARQILSLRRRHGHRIQLVLMNSLATDEDTRLALERHPELAGDVARTFLQSRFPKLWPEDLTPVTWPANPALEWAPPGHGDLYLSIAVSGVLGQLLENGYRYAFVSNSDNLGAMLDERILAWFTGARIPFLMEVADRSEADRKGGHLARLRGDGLVLRERAQTPESDVGAFQDIARHRFFNTNNLWLDLQALADLLDRREHLLELPLIVNRKPVEPADPSTPEAIQLETAMGAAIGVFEGAQALRVPRRRFAPVKTTDDLLAVRSDAYALTDEGHVELARERGDRPPVVELDPRFYKLLPDFDARFPAGPPSLVTCQRLRVRGDVRFGRGVVARGEVSIEHTGAGQLQIEDGAVLDGDTVSQPRSGEDAQPPNASWAARIA